MLELTDKTDAYEVFRINFAEKFVDEFLESPGRFSGFLYLNGLEGIKIGYFILKLLSKFICIFPLKFCFFIGDLLSKLAWVFIPNRRKKMTLENIQECLDVDLFKAEKISKISTKNLIHTFIEVLYFPKLKKNMKSHVKIVGIENLVTYMNSDERQGRGAIIATCHSDNWELMGGAFAQNNVSLVGVAKKQKSEGADKFINEYRTLMGMHITYKDDVRGMYKMLEKGHFIGLIMDQDIGRHDGTIVKFFNRATNYATGAASISRFRKVPIFPAFMHKNPDGTHVLEVHPPIWSEHTNDKRSDIQKMTQEIATLIENHIRHYPEEWFWLHDRWKSMRLEFTPEEIKDLNTKLEISGK